MAASSLARKYAEAAYSLASAAGRLDGWRASLMSAAAAAGEGGLLAQLSNPRVPFDNKAQLINAAFADEDEQVRNLLLLLAQRGRMALLPGIVDDFDRRLLEERGIARAKVTTAEPMDGATTAQLASELSRLTGKIVQVEAVVDPSIIGGFVARIGDKVLDGSSRTRLSALRRRLVG